jgi:hypothetical protein
MATSGDEIAASTAMYDTTSLSRELTKNLQRLPMLMPLPPPSLPLSHLRLTCSRCRCSVIGSGGGGGGGSSSASDSSGWGGSFRTNNDTAVSHQPLSAVSLQQLLVSEHWPWRRARVEASARGVERARRGRAQRQRRLARRRDRIE